MSLAAKRCVLYNPVFWFLDQGLSGDEHPPGGASQLDSILDVFGLWEDYDRGEMTF